MDINQAFPSKYLAAGDLLGAPLVLTMTIVNFEPMRDGTQKPILFFQGQPKGMVLNKTNGNTIASVYGSATEAWQGQVIELYPTTTEFGGEIVDCIRVRRQQPLAPQAGQPAPVGQPVPAATPPATMQPQTENPNPNAAPFSGDPLDA